jgi:rubrerythrin
MFDGMREEESGHRRRLLELFQKKFGEHIPLIRRQDVRGFVDRPALWLVRPLRIEAVRKEASTMEVETRRFYEKAAGRTQDVSIRQLLDDLAREEREHEERRRSSISRNCRTMKVRRGRTTAFIRAADCATRLGD